MMKNLYLLAALIIVIGFQTVLAQDIEPEFSQEKRVQTMPLNEYPVIYGEKGDELPERLRIRGVIEETTIASFSCGILHWNGTAKIKLLNKIKGYKHDYVYIVASCFFVSSSRELILNKVIEAKLLKFRNGKIEGGAIFNSIDSNGVAFYKLGKIKSIK